MSNIKELTASEQVLRRQLEKSIENGKKTALARRTQGFFEGKIEDLKRLWLKYDALDQDLNESLIINPSSSTEASKFEDNYSILEAKYSEYMGELLEGLRITSGVGRPLTTSASDRTTNHYETLLPKINLPKFSGDYDSWRSFHDLFLVLVHNNLNLTDVQKLYHLRSCLTGEAEQLVKHVPIINENYMPTWNKIKERFENKRILVNHHLRTLTQQPKVTTETASSLKSLLNTTEECLQQLQALQVDTTHWDTLLIHIITQKLPFMTLKLWEEEQGATQELPQYKQFSTFLQNRWKVLESISDTLNPKQSRNNPTTRMNTKAHHAINQAKCPACKGPHFIQRCKKYQNMNVQTRRRLINSIGHCFNCLSNAHLTKECTSSYRCLKCQQKHHTSLHENTSSPGLTTNGTTRQPNSNTANFQTQASHMTKEMSNGNPKSSGMETSISSANSSQPKTQSFITRRRQQVLLSTVLVRAEGDHGQSQVIRCLVDPGSESSFITQTACNKLAATCYPATVRITGLNTSPTGTSTKQTSLTLRSLESSQNSISETFLVVNKITDQLPSTRVSTHDCQHLQDLELADPTFWKPGTVQALLGAQAFAKIVQEGIRRGSEFAPIAMKTIFGWIILGSINEKTKSTTNVFTNQITNLELSMQLKAFWEQEEISKQPILSEEEKQCANFFTNTHIRHSSGKYQVQLPFKNNVSPTLGDSRPQAMKRYESLQRKFANNPEFAREYTACMDEYIQLGHMREVNPPKVFENHYYIPHHAVMKESTTTKLRVVFDASARTTNGKSLNEHLLVGPTIQPSLVSILQNWRKYRIAWHADIEKMYRMIEVHPKDQIYQRILWQHPDKGNIQDYQLTTVTFGTASAPYLAVRTLQQLAEDERLNWPLAAKSAQTSFYVDDLLTGADTVEEAEKLQDELIKMLRSGGFNLRKWSCNEKSLLERIPIEYQELGDTLSLSEENSIKTLGLQWHPSSDCFSFTIPPRKDYDTITKRTILSDVASLYDPPGWLQPITIVGKCMMQELWITGCSWDQPVSQTMKNQWIAYKKDLQNLSALKIPRWIRYSSKESMQLHGFCDASMKAYAAVLYLRVEHENGEISSTLLTSKSKVAPIKPVTIPRLELNGAVLLAKLIKTTAQTMQLQNIPVFAWTDSTIVLQWIREHPSRWKTYVANRIVEIQDIIKYDRWRHVPTQTNPADLACRGTSTANLITNDIWWFGPNWLRKKQLQWPQQTVTETQPIIETNEARVKNLVITLEDDIFCRYSSFTRLKRIIATMFRFIHNASHPHTKITDNLTPTELENAERKILKIVQQMAFTDEYKNLAHANPIASNSKLITLNPYMDSDGLIRIGGRLNKAAIPFERKHPIVLPKIHHVTSLIIDKIHLETLHGGVSLVLNTSRNNYWILDARKTITTRLHKCITCLRYRKSNASQLMGELPACRVNITKPFTNVGIDYAGPFLFKTGKHRSAKVQKAYFCIFVCMTTRAIHIELVSDLTSEAFIAALKRFISRRGLCRHIYSDCGTNFMGAKTILDKELKEAVNSANSDIADYLSSLAIEWHFNPPASPHFGGLWEAGVRSIKYHLRRTVGKSHYTFEEYATLLAQIEACLNSRPLCYISNNAEEPVVLTPAHFLIGHTLNTLPEKEENQGISYKHRWQHVQEVARHFWKKWSNDYLNQLQQRTKWRKRSENIEVGKVVILKGDNIPPIHWPLGIIEQVFPGEDGLVRVVQIRTHTNSFKRPISKIIPLPVESHTNYQTIQSLLNKSTNNNCCVLSQLNTQLPTLSRMNDAFEFQDDILDIEGDVLLLSEVDSDDDSMRLFVQPGFDCLTGLPKKEFRIDESHPVSSNESRQPQPSTSKEDKSQGYQTAAPESTPYTTPHVKQPANINGNYLCCLHKLRPTTNLKELEMRADNCYQRFTSREGTDIFLPKGVLQRLDLKALQKTKRKEKTVNLPGRYQARVRVKADGTIMFHHYHKRGITRIRNSLNEAVQRGEDVQSKPEKEQN